MKITILKTATGNVNMGGYFKNKTAQVFVVDYPEIGEKGKYFRFRYLFDRCDQCFNNIEEAMIEFNKAVKTFN